MRLGSRSVRLPSKGVALRFLLGAMVLMLVDVGVDADVDVCGFEFWGRDVGCDGEDVRSTTEEDRVEGIGGGSGDGRSRKSSKGSGLSLSWIRYSESR